MEKKSLLKKIDELENEHRKLSKIKNREGISALTLLLVARNISDKNYSFPELKGKYQISNFLTKEIIIGSFSALEKNMLSSTQTENKKKEEKPTKKIKLDIENLS